MVLILRLCEDRRGYLIEGVLCALGRVCVTQLRMFEGPVPELKMFINYRIYFKTKHFS